ncbi:MAG: hypothetical protein OXG82_22710 [Gammaproteobacteria bacterium]|nr:hypothetical protein [Gammaproteobacteria bacterium]
MYSEQMTPDPLATSDDLKESVALWLQDMTRGLTIGRFRFCRRRGFVPTDGPEGQVSTCFAVKIAWHIGAWQDWQADAREACIRFIQSFQTAEGNFVDEWLLRNLDVAPRLAALKRLRIADLVSYRPSADARCRAVRAETRQSAATLLMVGERPRFPLPTSLWVNESDVRQFVRSFDWSSPWGSGSHTSHLVSFLVINDRLRGEPSPSLSTLLDATFDEVNQFLDERTGTWGLGAISPVQRINGAMKMLTACRWANRPTPHPENLVDFALDHASGADGCGVLDRLFVLRNASLDAPDHRIDDIRQFAFTALGEIASHRQHDGAFSFSPARAQRAYYGALVSLGERQSDLHGTVMLTWAWAIALDILGLRERLGWRISVP